MVQSPAQAIIPAYISLPINVFCCAAREFPDNPTNIFSRQVTQTVRNNYRYDTLRYDVLQQRYMNILSPTGPHLHPTPGEN